VEVQTRAPLPTRAPPTDTKKEHRFDFAAFGLQADYTDTGPKGKDTLEKRCKKAIEALDRLQAENESLKAQLAAKSEI
jgi:hypothetical protein